MSSLPQNLFEQYHAHVYFDEQTVNRATSLCEEAAALFGVRMGRVHRQPVGPHPRWSCQLGFARAQFDPLVPWIEQHRQGLTVFIHPQTGDALKDHTTHASWLGEAAPLNLSFFGG